MVYLEVAPLNNFPKNLVYKSAIPQEELMIGKLVFVKVKEKIHPAFIVKLLNDHPKELPAERIGEILSLSPYPPFFDERMLSFYQFAASYYMVSLSTVLTSAFPNLGFFKIRESLDIGDEEELFKKRENIFFSKPKKISFSYLEEADDSQIKLKDEQKKVFDIIVEKAIDRPFLIFGKTGTGKTLLLLYLAKYFYEKGKSVLFMLPEIALAPHIYRRAMILFPKEDILVWHSSLTSAERRFVLETSARKNCLLIGTRSAIFLPLKELGLIIVDEEHDQSYKSDTYFAYNSRDLAFVLAKVFKVPLILSSATPSCETYFKVKDGQVEELKLEKPIIEEKKELILVNTEIEEMINPCFSKRLIEEIEKNLQSGEQSLLFINRRGYIPYVFCRDCKNFLQCKNCTVSLTWHKSKNLLICHRCGRSLKLPDNCPYCKSRNIGYFGMGTERVDELISERFPDARVLKIDSDSLEKRDFFKKHLEGLISGYYQIIVGTQIITKGIHLPNLTLVGVLSGEQGLSIPDFRAQERAFQLITQVGGRAGREKKGRIVIQTALTDLPVYKLALNEDYVEFYRLETESRKVAGFPPFKRLLVIKLSGRNEQRLKELASEFFIYFQKKNKNRQIDIYPPMQAPVYREKGLYRYQIYLKADNPKKLIRVAQGLKSEMKIPSDIKVYFDMDPYNLL